jgi:tRNA-specific adenosine deaminase 1
MIPPISDEHPPVATTAAAAVLSQFASLPRHGRPQRHEHTVLAGIVATSVELPSPVVLALATGTKCLPAGARANDGCAVNDCHAEVLCRRALLRWLRMEALDLLEGGGGVGEGAETVVLRCRRRGREECASRVCDLVVELRPGVQLRMFVSQPPCGDAAILHRGRTGAKPLVLTNGSEVLLPTQSEVESYSAPQAAGLARRKPGRGEATLSMSCTDKLSRWWALGLQGSLESCLLGPLGCPLRLAGLVVAAPFGATEEERAEAEEAVRRGVVGRAAQVVARLPSPFALETAPELDVICLSAETLHVLGLSPGGERKVASGSSMVWVAPPSAQFKFKEPPAASSVFAKGPVLRGGTQEALAGASGLRLGHGTRRHGGRAAARSMVSKAEVLLLHHRVERALVGAPGCQCHAGNSALGTSLKQQTYRHAKEAAGAAYRAAWAVLKAPPSPFQHWIPKPVGEEDFVVLLDGMVDDQSTAL